MSGPQMQTNRKLNERAPAFIGGKINSHGQNYEDDPLAALRASEVAFWEMTSLARTANYDPALCAAASAA
jgi:hypothetical protein